GLLDVPESCVATDDLWAAVCAKVGDWLPDGDSTLQRALASLVLHTVPRQRRLATIPALLATPVEPTAAAVEVPYDQVIEDGWNGLAAYRAHRPHGLDGRRTLIPMVRALGDALGGADAAPGDGNTNWLTALTALGAIAMRAASPATGA